MKIHNYSIPTFSSQNESIILHFSSIACIQNLILYAKKDRPIGFFARGVLIQAFSISYHQNNCPAFMKTKSVSEESFFLALS